MNEITICLLELENQKYYLTYSATKNSKEIFERHLRFDNNIEWTSKNKPLSVLKSFKGTMDDLKGYSKEFFTEYGLNLRGTFIDGRGLKNSSKSSNPKRNSDTLTIQSDLADDILECLDDPLDIRVLKMGSGTKRFYVVNSMDPQDFYNKMSSGLLPDDILDVPIVLSGTVKTSKDLFNKLVMKYGLDSIGFWKS